jgi:hypothetical protein
MPVLTVPACTRATPLIIMYPIELQQNLKDAPGAPPRRCGAPGCDCVVLPVHQNYLFHGVENVLNRRGGAPSGAAACIATLDPWNPRILIGFS